MRRILAMAALVATVLPAAAQQVMTSPAPEGVQVTVYRAPDRGADQPIDANWLAGYALITERRTIDLPAGRAVVRFEGVAGGMFAESAILTGLPGGVREKNLDADLLSPRSLYARALGRPVTIRRTHLKSGRVVEEPAIIRSGPDGAAIVQTRDGFFAADCGPTDDDIVYDGVPPGLSARPTLSVELDSPMAQRVTIGLSYLAWGFDWQADYVATLAPDGRSLDLTAWVTLASGDPTSFVAAETGVVAGRVNREDRRPYRDAAAAPLQITCGVAPPPPPPPPSPPLPLPVAAPPIADYAQEIVVTANRVSRKVVQEELGDLKFYRVPFATTVAANAQKQVALLEKSAVPVERYVAIDVFGGGASAPMTMLRVQNRTDRGLGVALPAGQVAVFAAEGTHRLLLGQGSVEDKAVGEPVEIGVAPATQVTQEVEAVRSDGDWTDHRLTLRNATPDPVRVEARFRIGDSNLSRTSARLGRKDGDAIWIVEVPGNATRALSYRVTAR